MGLQRYLLRSNARPGFAVAAMVVLLLIPSPSSATVPETAMLQRVLPAVVGIAVAKDRSQEDWLWNSARKPGGIGWEAAFQLQVLGSGFFVDATGTVATARHVVRGIRDAGRRRLFVITEQGRAYAAVPVRVSQADDVAVVLAYGIQGARYLEMRPWEELRVGMTVYAVGNPKGIRMVVTKGVISALHSGVDPFGAQDLVTRRLIQTDAPISPGNSGGPLVDTQGRVVGVNVMKGAGGAIEGMAFAVPAYRVKRLLALARGETEPGCMGFRVQPDRRTPFLQVVAVEPGSAAAKAGLQVGDLLIAFDGMPATSIGRLSQVAGEVLIGVPAYLAIVRAERRHEFKIVPGRCSTGVRPTRRR